MTAMGPTPHRQHTSFQQKAGRPSYALAKLSKRDPNQGYFGVPEGVDVSKTPLENLLK